MRIALISIMTLLVCLICSNWERNVIFLIMETNYYIPKQSSIFTFHYTLYNSGSGEYWLYGENYYENMSSERRYFPKNKAWKCVGFDPLNHEIWCVTY